MKNKRSVLIVCAASLAMASAPARAAITYVDAVAGVSGNTFETGSTPDDTNWSSATAQNQGLWQERTGFGNNGNIFQAWFADSVPEITTRITGLPDGIYDVYVFFWDAPNSNTWGIDAGLTSGSLTRYSFDGAGITDQTVAASTLDFVANPMFTEGDRVLYGVNLGQATVTGGSAIDVFVDGTVPGADNRVWYDGVGYELVPEPSIAFLGGLGLLGLLRRRR